VLATVPIAALHANADLLVGLLVGVCIGLLSGPLVRSWLVYREWTETSREARLTDELLSRIDRDLDDLPDPDADRTDLDGTWRTSA
jgi:hypothetical protein